MPMWSRKKSGFFGQKKKIQNILILIKDMAAENLACPPGSPARARGRHRRIRADAPLRHGETLGGGFCPPAAVYNSVALLARASTALIVLASAALSLWILPQVRLRQHRQHVPDRMPGCVWPILWILFSPCVSAAGENAPFKDALPVHRSTATAASTPCPPAEESQRILKSHTFAALELKLDLAIALGHRANGAVDVDADLGRGGLRVRATPRVSVEATMTRVRPAAWCVLILQDAVRQGGVGAGARRQVPGVVVHRGRAAQPQRGRRDRGHLDDKAGACKTCALRFLFSSLETSIFSFGASSRRPSARRSSKRLRRAVRLQPLERSRTAAVDALFRLGVELNRGHVCSVASADPALCSRL